MREFNAVAGTALMLAFAAGPGQSIAYAADPEPLQLEVKIPLGEVSGRMGHGARGPADLPAVGDWVAVDAERAGDRATIRRVLGRKSMLSRAAPAIAGFLPLMGG